MFRYKELFVLNKTIVHVGGYIIYLKNAILNPILFKVIKRNHELTEIKKSDTCYVCALGPSLKNVDFSRLNGDSFVVNDFYKMNDSIGDFCPTYYILADTAYMMREHKEKLDKVLKLYKSKETKILLNSKMLLINKSFYKELAKNTYFLSMFRGGFNKNSTINISKVLPAIGNVANVAIVCAMALGYKRIILLGCDFNSFAYPKPIHCYDDSTEERQITLALELFNYSFEADTHCEIDAYAKNNGIEIINASRGSLIDAYKREDIPFLYMN